MVLLDYKIFYLYSNLFGWFVVCSVAHFVNPDFYFDTNGLSGLNFKSRKRRDLYIVPL